MPESTESCNDSVSMPELHIQDIFNNAPIGVFTTTPEGRIILANAALVRMLGYESPEELIASITDLATQVYADPADRKEFMRLLEKHGAVLNHECRFRRRGGAALWGSVNVRAIRDKDGRIVAYQGFITDITEHKTASEKLKRLEWMLSGKPIANIEVQPEAHDQGYGDLTELNRDGLILKSIGRERLEIFANDYMDLLGTSSAIYEVNGDYAFGIFSSGWCQMLDSASRKLCDTPDNVEALNSGRWLCHESCWTHCSREVIAKLAPVDIACNGGLRIYAVPILAYGEVVGAINFGYGDPPNEPEKLRKLAKAYHLDDDDLVRAAHAYDSRPPFVIELAKKRLHATARLIGAMIETQHAEEALRRRLDYEQLLNEASTMAFVADDLAEFHDRCLALVGERVGIDRAYFFRHDEATDTMDNTHEWCAKGIPPQQDKLQGMPGSAFSWWLQTMRRNEIICYSNIEEIPDQATKEMLRSQDIKSILVVPLFINGQYYGFLGFDDVARRRGWQQEDVDILLSLSRIVAMATERRQAEKRLQDERQQLLSIFNGIEEAIYIADPVTYEILFVNNFGKKMLSRDFLGKKCYEQIQGFSAPCEFCTNKIILQNPGGVYRWEYYNPNLNRHYLLFDRIIKWADGRDVRFEMAIDITDRKQVEEALRESEEKFRSLVEQAAEMLFLHDLKGHIIDVNLAAIQNTGYSREELKRMTVFDIDPDARDRGDMQKYWKSFKIGDPPASFEVKHKRKNGSIYPAEVLLSKIALQTDHYILVLAHDTTERKQAEAEREKLQTQLNQAQKMESVGRLAGGVAHDFNNMLGVILGHTEMALEQVDPDQPLFAGLQQVRKAAERSAELTRQLLAFARKQTIAPRVIDINETVEGMLKMLRRLISEDMDLLWKPGRNPGPVKMDPSQIDQLLANLCVNARDAITGVGKITIETDDVVFDEAYCADHAGFVPGEYVLLAVSDNGCGMDQETLGHLFEPFFTTKEQGKGTGLGLASVYGMVKQNNGFINVYSEPGRGTTFKVYLPRHAVKTTLSPPEKVAEQPAERGHEIILLVEDEPAILKMTTMMLERLGYAVLAAATPGQAIRLAREHADDIHLLMTDVVMPEMNGRDLAQNLLSIYPGIKRLFMSGYTANVIAHHGVLDQGVYFIQKPFSLKDLGMKLREVLEDNNAEYER